ncbi:MAG: endonuclease/exonuclease/phosphatase family protein, partial [Verrucomicrobiota bacterium]
TTGVVTHLEASSSGVKRFFLQDEGQAVSCYLPRRLPLKLQAGQWATVEGMVNEYRPGNGSFSNTEIPILLMDQVKSGRPAALPEPRELDFSKMAQLSPSQAMEAYEPLESMLVRVRNPRVLDRFNDWESRRTVVAVIPDSVSANERNSVGTLTVTAREHSNRNWDSRYEFDFNAERIFIEHEGSAKISTVGTRLKDVVGVLDLSSGQPLLLPIDKLQIESEAKPKAAPLNLSAENGQMMIATYNLWNLSADDSERITKIAEQIADDLKAPDLVALAEVQDDSGTRNSIADLTLSSRKFAEKLTPALSKKGADYRYLDREPLRHREGGVPGGNIRVGFLYKPERVRPVGEPFRIPDDSRPVTEHLAFEGTRKALGSRFEFVPTNQPFFAIATHLKSKRGDDFVWKKNPQFDSEDQRVQQCLTLVNAVEALKASEPDLPILLMGDFNDYAKSNSLRILTESGFLTNVLDQLPPEEQFTYRYRGNVSTLDHILVSPELANQAQCQILHLNTISLDRSQLASDHDPIVATVVMD